MKNYSKKFYSNQQVGSLNSAKEIIPLIMDLIPVKSVLDVGCGVGTWLSVFQDRGVVEFLGLDGEYIDKSSLFIPKDNFVSCDLRHCPNDVGFYDLVVSLEVAEHLPEKNANDFVKFLISSASVVIFSAAIPGQGGINHLNEQWPEYWIDKFKKHNFICIDCLRRRIWSNKNVKWWYSQNMFIFVDAEKIDQYPKLKKEIYNNSDMLSVVHPDKYWQTLNTFSFKNLFKKFF